MNWIARMGERFARKSPTPIVSESWLMSAMNGTAERTSQVDLMATASVNRAVTRIAHDMASVPLVIEEKVGAEWKKVEPAERNQRKAKHGDVAGVFERANPREGKTALWIRFHSSMELDGAAVLFTDYLNGGREPKGSAPKELRFLRPDKLTPIYPQQRTAFSDPVGYRFNGTAGVQMLRPDEVLWHVYPDPRDVDGLRGLAPAEAARPFAAIDAELPEYVLDYFANGARGSLAFCSDQTPGEEQRKQLEAEIKRAHVGRGKRFKIILATHGLKVQELNGRRDTDFPDLFDIITQRVSMIFGVPPAFLSDYGDSGVRANLEEQTPIYVEGTLMPKGALLEQSLTELVLPRFGDNLRARLDWDSTPMVQRMLLKKASAYFTLVGGPVMAVNEARRDLNLEPLIGGDTTYPQGVAPTGIGPVQAPRAARTVLPGKALKWIDDPARHAKRIASGVSLDRFEKPAEKMVRAYFTQAEARALHAFENGNKRFTKSDFFDEGDEVEVATGLIARIYAHVATTRGPEAIGEVGGDPAGFLIDAPEVRAFLDARAYENGKRITGTTADMLRQVIETANAEGLTIEEAANQIRDVFALRRDHALTIARTETVRAYNFTTVEAWKQSGLVESIAWLTAHDDAVRDSHAALDGEERELGKEFKAGLKFPGDPDCEDPSEVCNCRCTVLTVETPVKRFAVAPGTFRKLFPLAPLTNGNSCTDKAAL